MKTFLKSAFAVALVLSFTNVNAAETINGAGATFPYPVYSAWAASLMITLFILFLTLLGRFIIKWRYKG